MKEVKSPQDTNGVRIHFLLHPVNVSTTEHWEADVSKGKLGFHKK